MLWLLGTRTRTAAAGLATIAMTAGCGTPPPASQPPSARAAIDRLRATQDCGVGVHAQAKIDHFGKQGRVRGDLLLYAMWPAQLRMDVVSPFGVTLATLASNGKDFSLSDLREKRFFVGPASACNIARLTQVAMPGHVLVSLLRGDAPVLQHDPSKATLAWDRSGFYVVRIAGANQTEEEIALEPHPDDVALPWDKQRMRVRRVKVVQEGIVLYDAELEDHKPAKTAKERVDPDGIDAPVPPSGPVCGAELPRRMHVSVPGTQSDVRFRYDDVTWNPPIVEGLFTQPVPGGLEIVRVTCER